MRVLVQVRGDLDPSDLWPYVTASRATGSGCRLLMRLHDSRELVCVLVALADRDLEVVEVVEVDAAAPAGAADD